ncbi:MAG: hypothetical protein KJN62_02635 [Deltaproteobacteria bacterium]|nr:hypothetical protein [Deltaproteobacteria bacterium]
MRRTVRIAVVTTVIMAVLCLYSTVWAKTKMVQSKTAMVTTSKVLVTQNPKIVKLKGPVSSKYVVPPKPLSRTMKAAYSREMLRGVGVQKVELPPQVTKVKLTPDAPRSGFNWYEVTLGYNFPFPKNNKPAYTCIMDRSYKRGFINLHLERTIPGKLYMLDLAVSTPYPNKTKYVFRGAVEGEIKPQHGHLVAGFVANRAISELLLDVEGGTHGIALIYSIEVTQVN